MNKSKDLVVGRVISSSIIGWSAVFPSKDLGELSYGGLIMAAGPAGELIVGIVTNILVEGDKLVEQLAVSEVPLAPEVIFDNRENRIKSVKANILTLGYIEEGASYYRLAYQPPLTLWEVEPMIEGVLRMVWWKGPDYVNQISQMKRDLQSQLLAAHVFWLQSQKSELAAQMVDYLSSRYRHDYDILSVLSEALAGDEETIATLGLRKEPR
jgi:hypothetical protein